MVKSLILIDCGVECMSICMVSVVRCNTEMGRTNRTQQVKAVTWCGVPVVPLTGWVQMMWSTYIVQRLKLKRRGVSFQIGSASFVPQGLAWGACCGGLGSMRRRLLPRWLALVALIALLSVGAVVSQDVDASAGSGGESDSSPTSDNAVATSTDSAFVDNDLLYGNVRTVLVLI